MRITIACPDALRDDANQIAMVLGFGPADAETYGELNWQDADGNLYACASLPVSETFTTTAQSGLQRPAWNTDNHVNLDAARRAQSALVFSLTPSLGCWHHPATNQGKRLLVSSVASCYCYGPSA